MFQPAPIYAANQLINQVSGVAQSLLQGDWDSALEQAGVVSGQTRPIMAFKQPVHRVYNHQKPVWVSLVSRPYGCPNICPKMVKKMAYILSNLDPKFADSATVAGQPGKNDILVDLRSAAIADALKDMGATNQLVEAAMHSQYIKNAADQAILEAFYSQAQPGLSVSGTVGGDLYAYGDPETVGSWLSKAFKSVKKAVKTITKPIESAIKGAGKMVKEISKGNVASAFKELTKVGENIMFAPMKTISQATGVDVMAIGKEIAKQVLPTAMPGIGQALVTATELFDSTLESAVAKQKGLAPPQAQPPTAQQLAAASAEGARLAVTTAATPEKQAAAAALGIYKPRHVKTIIYDLQKLSNTPEELIEILTKVLKSKYARRDPVKALRRYLRRQMKYVEDDEQYQEVTFTGESELLGQLAILLGTVQSRKDATLVMVKFLDAVKTTYSGS